MFGFLFDIYGIRYQLDIKPLKWLYKPKLRQISKGSNDINFVVELLKTDSSIG
jgi:hypothetical protein